MKNNKMDAEYYVFDSDGSISAKMPHPYLAWGKYNDTPFLRPERIDRNDLPTPLHVEFQRPTPKTYEMVDIHKLGSQFACTEQLKALFEQVHGIDFFAIDAVVTPQGEQIEGYCAIHVWNCIDALDRDNTVGLRTNMRGRIISMQRFALNERLLEAIPLEKRLVFRLQEPPGTCILHASIAEKMLGAGLAGLLLERVEAWRRRE